MQKAKLLVFVTAKIQLAHGSGATATPEQKPHAVAVRWSVVQPVTNRADQASAPPTQLAAIQPASAPPIQERTARPMRTAAPVRVATRVFVSAPTLLAHGSAATAIPALKHRAVVERSFAVRPAPSRVDLVSAHPAWLVARLSAPPIRVVTAPVTMIAAPAPAVTKVFASAPIQIDRGSAAHARPAPKHLVTADSAARPAAIRADLASAPPAWLVARHRANARP